MTVGGGCGQTSQLEKGEFTVVGHALAQSWDGAHLLPGWLLQAGKKAWLQCL